MWIYLKNNWVLFILKMSDSRGSPCISRSPAVVARSPAPPLQRPKDIRYCGMVNDASSISEDLEDYGYCQWYRLQTTQEVLRNFSNPNVHNRQPWDHTLSQLNSLTRQTQCPFLKIHCNTALPPTEHMVILWLRFLISLYPEFVYAFLITAK